MKAQQHYYHADMLGVEEALARILAHFQPLDSEEKPIVDALGQTLAEEIVATFPIPPMDNAAMDGYAVRARDLAKANKDSPVTLRVIDQVAAGELPRATVVTGTAARIMTGAPMPQGADTVVPFEDTDEVERKAAGKSLEEVAVFRAPRKGANVRSSGEDVAQGEMVLPRGTVLRPAEIGVLASVGHATVKVVRRPVVAILATGDELLTPGQPLEPGKIWDSNSYGLAAGVLRCGGVPRLLGIARDNLEDMNRKLDKGLTADLLLTSAGVSRGDYDMVKDVLAQRGDIGFWSVRMRPAKPLAFGLLLGPGGRRVPHIGLPGNPVSALVALEVLVRPTILRMLGRTRFSRPTIKAVLESPIVNTDGRRVYARVLVSRHADGYHARAAGAQGSNILTAMARGNGLAICPEDVPQLKAGQLADVLMLDWPEEVEL